MAKPAIVPAHGFRGEAAPWANPDMSGRMDARKTIRLDASHASLAFRRDAVTGLIDDAASALS